MLGFIEIILKKILLSQFVIFNEFLLGKYL